MLVWIIWRISENGIKINGWRIDKIEIKKWKLVFVDRLRFYFINNIIIDWNKSVKVEEIIKWINEA